MRSRAAIALLLGALLWGCGGGSDGPDTTAGAPEPTPTGEATADPAVAERAAVEDRVDAMRAEIAALRAMQPRGVTNAFYKLDGLALRLGSQHFKADTRRIDRLDDGGYFTGGLQAGLLQDAQRQQWNTMVPTWRRYAAKLDRLSLKGAIVRSTQAFQLAEWRRSIAVMQDFLGYLRSEPPSSTHEGYYQPRALGQESRWPVVVGDPFNRRKPLIKGLQGDIRRVKGAERLGPGSPSVGDTYRRSIERSFLSPLRDFKRREPLVAAQLWRLFRIRELEDTPAEAYERARSTIALQGLDDERNPFAAIADIGLEFTDQSVFERKGLVAARRHRAWALELLARPVPPLLEDMRAQMVAVYKSIDLESPPSGDDFALFDLDDALDRDQKRMERVLFKGAKLVDSPRVLRRAIEKTLRATRPAP